MNLSERSRVDKEIFSYELHSPENISFIQSLTDNIY